MSHYTINEPHPTYSSGAYTHSGRGGAGNTFRVSASDAASASAALNQQAAAPKPSTRFYSGRGGAGNAHKSVPAPVLSFDEEYARAIAHDSASAGHVGRGGAGNVFGAPAAKSETSGSAGSPRSSAEHADARSLRSGFWARLSGTSVGHN